MKFRNLMLALAFGAGCTLLGARAVAQDKKDEKKAEPAKPAAAAPAPAKPADKQADKSAAPAAKPGDKSAGAATGDPTAPGEFHAKLKVMEGNWEANVKAFMDPNSPTESKGACTRKWIMDGRFLQEDFTSDFMGMPFKGMGVFGYDNVTKKFVSSWIDNMGTGISYSTGGVDATGKTFNYEGDSSDPMSGKVVKVKMVTKIIDDKKHTFEMFGPGPDGKEAKMMEITYTKK